MLRTVVIVVVALALGACSGAHRAGRNATHEFREFAVAADHPEASRAGAEMLELGGNAVDAAVATSFALSVVRPYSTGLGGGGFMLIHLDDDPRYGDLDIVIDFRERAPRSMGPDHFESLPEYAPRHSGHAAGIPGFVAGLLHALDTYGTLDRQTVLAPAIRIARDGWAIDDHQRMAIDKLAAVLAGDERQSFPESDRFLRETYIDALETGMLFNPAQARCLQLIADRGAAAFYDGPVTTALIDAVRRSGGTMTAADLAYYRISELTPLRGSFMGRTVLAMPLPSSGGLTVLQAMAFCEARGAGSRSSRPTDGAYAHLLVESWKHAFADRATYLGDPEFMATDPTPLILDPMRIAQRASLFDPNRTLPTEIYGEAAPIALDEGTSHLSVIDAQGNAVACTSTINLTFGAKIAVPEFGFCLNNENDDFLARRGVANAYGLVQSDRNLPEPGKRPLSSMTPTIVLDPDGAVEMVAGASGGPRIITATMQVLLNVLLFDYSAGRAVTELRMHHQWIPDRVQVEDELAERHPDLLESLAGRGHEVFIGMGTGAAVQAIVSTPGGLEAASDPRKGGVPAGR